MLFSIVLDSGKRKLQSVKRVCSDGCGGDDCLLGPDKFIGQIIVVGLSCKMLLLCANAVTLAVCMCQMVPCIPCKLALCFKRSYVLLSVKGWMWVFLVVTSSYVNAMMSWLQ